MLATLRSIYEGLQEIRPNGLKPYYRPLSDELARLGQQTSQPVTPKNYVLIIDEINRANMSRVFGESITLLEEDKRLGEDNELIVTLPSGEAFSVPPNLYLIGTMNTADKSGFTRHSSSSPVRVHLQETRSKFTKTNRRADPERLEQSHPGPA